MQCTCSSHQLLVDKWPINKALDLSTYMYTLQYWSLLNWQNLRLHCGCVAVPVNWIFDINSSFFAKFKNVVQSLEPGGSRVTRRLTRLKLCAMFLNIAKYYEISTKFQFTETATEPQRNRIFRQFYNDQYCRFGRVARNTQLFCLIGNQMA